MYINLWVHSSGLGLQKWRLLNSWFRLLQNNSSRKWFDEHRTCHHYKMSSSRTFRGVKGQDRTNIHRDIPCTLFESREREHISCAKKNWSYNINFMRWNVWNGKFGIWIQQPHVIEYTDLEKKSIEAELLYI